MLGGFGYFGGVGVMVGVMGIVDLLIGIVYLAGLPKALDRTHVELLLDKVSVARTRSSAS